MIFIDTGYLIALLNPGDELHVRAAKWTSHIHEPLLVSEYILWELGNAFSRPANRPRFHGFLDSLASENSITVVQASPELYDVGLREHRQRPDKEWSLTDCISFHLMGHHGVSRALSHDHHFEQAGFEALLRRDPP